MLLLEKEFITEAKKSDDSFWYIDGIFMQANVVNKNRRIYPEWILDREARTFIDEMVVTKRAFGELSHPDSSTINPDRVCILIEDMNKIGADWIGRAKVVRSTTGNIVSALLDAGGRVGVSSRASGDVKKNRDGIDEVQDNLKLHTIDVVLNPSAPNAMMNAVFENEEAIESILLDDHLYEEFRDFLIAKTKAKKTRDKQLRESIIVDAIGTLLKRI